MTKADRQRQTQGYLVISAMGSDRPGFVDHLSEILLQHGANVEESRMARLGGEFAMIVLVSAPARNVEALSSYLSQMTSESLMIVSRMTEARTRAVEGYIPYQLSVRGADHEGIIQSVAHYLAAEGINIAELRSEVDQAPMTGAKLFSMQALIQVPPRLTLQFLRSGLLGVSEKEGVDIEVKIADG